MNANREPVPTLSASGRAPSTKPASPDRQVLALVLDAVTLPFAATVGENEKRTRLMEQRLSEVGVFLRGYLTDQDDYLDQLRAEMFAGRVATFPPVDYVTAEQAHARLAAGATWTEAVRPAEEVS